MKQAVIIFDNGGAASYPLADCGPESTEEDVDLCAILGHDLYHDEPDHCGRCDAHIDGEV